MPGEQFRIVSMLSVPICNGVPVMPAVVDGRPVDLSEYEIFEVHEPGRKPSALKATDFFARYMPTRMLFAKAGRG